MVSPTPHRFTNPAWELGDVFGWLLDRDQAKFGRILTADDWRSALWQLNYTSFPRPEHDPEAATSLLHVLQRGELIAFDTSSQPVKPYRWLAKDERDLRAATRKYLFRRVDILRLRPDPQAQTVLRAPPPTEPLRGVQNPVIKDTMGNKTPDWSWWKHVPDVKLREGIALSLNVDPKSGLQLLTFDERREFGKRWTLAMRCVGASLAGPLNWKGVRYYDEEPVVKLRTFAAWAISVEWKLPLEILELGQSKQPTTEPIVTEHPAASPLEVNGRRDETDTGGNTNALGQSLTKQIYRTGLAGRPTSWRLIEAECRRRYADGERYATKAEWAATLLDWLGSAHPNAPVPTAKTLTSNHLPKLLARLQAEERNKIGRPK